MQTPLVIPTHATISLKLIVHLRLAIARSGCLIINESRLTNGFEFEFFQIFKFFQIVP